MDRKCETCGKGFRAKPAVVAIGHARFCSRACFETSRRGPRKPGVSHRMMKARGHPLAPPSGTVGVARIVLYEKIGPGAHPCHWCGAIVEWMVGAGVRNQRTLIADHLDHDPTNDAAENLVPSCNPCNAHRRSNGGSPIIQVGELTIIKSDGTKVRAAKQSCEFCGSPFLAAASQIRVGKARFCSRSCARSGPRA